MITVLQESCEHEQADPGNGNGFSDDYRGGACSSRCGEGAACRRNVASSVDTNHGLDIDSRSSHVANGAANNVAPIDRSRTIAATRGNNFDSVTTADTSGEILCRA